MDKSKDQANVELISYYLEVLRMEIDDTVDANKKISLLDKYIDLLKQMLKVDKTKRRELFVRDLIANTKEKLECMPDGEEKSEVYEELRKFIYTELKLKS